MFYFKKLSVLIILFILALTPFSLYPGEPDSDDTIIFPFSYGWITGDRVNINIHAWIFEAEENSLMRKGVFSILDKYFENASSDEREIFRNRIKYFFFDNERGKNIEITLWGKKIILPRTSANGHTSKTEIFSIHDYKFIENKIYTFETDNLPVSQKFNGSFQLIGPEGTSVISDIDDTIKISNVLNKDELIKNTFFRKFQAVDGMSEFYNNLKKSGCVFHYISGSPWQLYTPINDFIKNEKFPPGSIDLKFFRLKDRSSLEFMKADQFQYKYRKITSLIDKFPGRKFILIGDSGEKDPEIYSEISKKFKNRVSYILIRDVGQIDKDSKRRKEIINTATFSRIIIFKNPKELTRLNENF